MAKAGCRGKKDCFGGQGLSEKYGSRVFEFPFFAAKRLKNQKRKRTNPGFLVAVLFILRVLRRFVALRFSMFRKNGGKTEVASAWPSVVYEFPRGS
jgi:hypothetical protein